MPLIVFDTFIFALERLVNVVSRHLVSEKSQDISGAFQGGFWSLLKAFQGVSVAILIDNGDFKCVSMESWRF